MPGTETLTQNPIKSDSVCSPADTVPDAVNETDSAEAVSPIGDSPELKQEQNSVPLPDAKDAKLKIAFSDLSEDSRKKAAELLYSLPKSQRQGAVSISRKREIFQGPFPHPRHAEHYERLCPKFMERSLIMAEKAQEANIINSKLQLENERIALQNEGQKIARDREHDRLDSNDTRRPQYLGFAGFVILVIAATVLALWGHEKTSMALFGGFGIAVFGCWRKIFAGKFSAQSAK